MLSQGAQTLYFLKHLLSCTYTKLYIYIYIFIFGKIYVHPIVTFNSILDPKNVLNNYMEASGNSTFESHSSIIVKFVIELFLTYSLQISPYKQLSDGWY